MKCTDNIFRHKVYCLLQVNRQLYANLYHGDYYNYHTKAFFFSDVEKTSFQISRLVVFVYDPLKHIRRYVKYTSYLNSQ